MSNMTKKQFYTEIELILELPPDSVNGVEVLADFEGWDSLAVISFLAMADAKFETILSATQLANCRTIEDLTKLFPGKISEDCGIIA